jgi:hypothetical protein
MRPTSRAGLFFLFIVGLNVPGFAQSGIITTYVGPGMPVNGGPATEQAIDRPTAVALNGAGGFYLTSEMQNRVYRVSADGRLSFVAGNGTPGFSGDGGPATSAQFLYPGEVAVDIVGNLFIADTGTTRIRKVTPAGVISTVAGYGYGFGGDGGPATSAQLNLPRGVAVDSLGDLYIADTANDRIRKVAGGPGIAIDLALGSGGATSSSTVGEGEAVHAGYAVLAVKSGAAPYGTAVFSFKENGVTVSEAGVPASPPTTSTRIFIDYRSAIPAVPGRIEAGMVDVNTGIAAVNRGSARANVTYLLRDLRGTTISTGRGTIAGGAHFAKFIAQLKDVASGFSLSSDFQSTIQFGSLEISSDQPLSIVALRMTTNQRNEVLFTTTPTADLNQSLMSTPVCFPQFADGGGYTTAMVLLNTSTEVETGTFKVLDDLGTPLVVNQVGGTADSRDLNDDALVEWLHLSGLW